MHGMKKAYAKSSIWLNGILHGGPRIKHDPSDDVLSAQKLGGVALSLLIFWHDRYTRYACMAHERDESAKRRISVSLT